MSERRPNLVFFLADQLRRQSCGHAGDTRARTPNINAFAGEGVDFRQAISGHPVCAAYRASLFTGKYTTSTGMVINELRINPNHECIGHVLTRAGYDTSYIGKWHLWANQLGNHRDPKNSFTPPGPYRLGFDGFWASYGFNHEYYRGYYHTDSPEQIPVEGFEPDFQTTLAIDQIEKLARGEKPFALFLAVGTPHDPWGPDNVPPEYLRMFAQDTELREFDYPPNYKPDDDPYSDNWGKFKPPSTRAAIPNWMRVYYAMIANLDWNFGRLIKTLDRAGLGDDTIVVFTSDHGEMFGAQGRRAKNIFYEEAVRVPFLMRMPGRIPAGSVTDACLNTPDIMPTLLSMMGLPIPSKVEGCDFSQLALECDGSTSLSASSRRVPKRCRAIALQSEVAFMQNTGACASWDEGFEWRAVRSKRHTYAVYRIDGHELLFDNEGDPYQMRNLAGDPAHREVREHLRSLMEARMEELGDTNESSAWYRDHWTADRCILIPR